MPVDFRDSAQRHWEDANYLMSDGRLANADHLFGLSAECALKAFMQGLGMTLGPDGKPQERQHKVHINNLWNEFKTFANARGGALYASRLSGVSNPFGNWDVSQRYEHRSGITRDIAEMHKNGANIAMQLLDEAILNGDIL